MFCFFLCVLIFFPIWFYDFFKFFFLFLFIIFNLIFLGNVAINTSQIWSLSWRSLLRWHNSLEIRLHSRLALLDHWGVNLQYCDHFGARHHFYPPSKIQEQVSEKVVQTSEIIFVSILLFFKIQKKEWKSFKMPHLKLSFLAFPANFFFLLKLTCLATLFDQNFSFFLKTCQNDHFWHF